MGLYRSSHGAPQALNPGSWYAAIGGGAQALTGVYAQRAGFPLPVLTPANLAPISLMKNDAYQNDEADNLKTMLSDRLKLSYQTFSDISVQGLSAALSGCRVLLIPELEKEGMFAALSAESRSLLQYFVGGGGHMLLFYGSTGETSSISLLNLFGLNVTAGADASSKTLKKVDAPQIPNLPADLPATLTGYSATNALVCPSSGPAQPLYVDEVGNPVVVSFPYGNGRVSYLGWDWYGDVPTAQQADWERVLQGLMNV
ncbi:hypothetical protein [Chromobacterium subtsugae]|uniref:hypothetical protein n=1 Tax=Chromobacterium subtsugae TaxID=251747 RepID=UPI000640D747|nr:hypothetical protein [Chromobacterium subtsugae]